MVDAVLQFQGPVFIVVSENQIPHWKVNSVTIVPWFAYAAAADRQ